MSCIGCAKKFTPFRSEVGCPGCGFSYCKNCLDNKIFLEKYNKEKKVCHKCKMSEGKMNNDPPSFDPPKAFLKRLENLENPSKPPITMYQAKADKMRQLKDGLSPADQEIVDRLEKLKEDKRVNAVPSENEIRERLARLRDESMTTVQKKSH